MKHSPTLEEQGILDLLLERIDFEFVPIRLTATMLEKAIMDARGPLRAYLARTGIVDYAAIPQGSAHKLQVRLPLVTARGVEERTISFYRPSTKQGDPRIWIERLGDTARAGDLLAIAFSGSNAIPFVVKGDAERLAAHLGEYLPSRFEERARIEATVADLMRLLAPLRGEWIQTKRPGPTGVGYTLETLVGIRANVSRVADFRGVELKSYRRGALSGAGKLVTLFSKTPTWTYPDKGIGLLRKFGYQDAQRGRLALYCTVMCKLNRLGWQLQLSVDEQRVNVANRGAAAMSYTFATLETRLKEKHPATLFVQASSRGDGRQEEFRYETVMLCWSPSFSNFLDLTQENQIGLDLTLHQKASGVARDHGYLWRIREPKIPELFAYRKPLL